MKELTEELANLITDMLVNGACRDELYDIIGASKDAIDAKKLCDKMKEKYSNFEKK